MSVDEPTAGDILGTYRLEAEIAKGGAARLFRARHINPAWGERVFALKVLQARRATDTGFVSAFRREAYLLSTLEHANIVETFESGIQGDGLFIAMEYVHGRDFGDVLDGHAGPLPLPLAIHIIREVLEALAHAHGRADEHGVPRGVIHHDVKPSNVLISYDGHVKLTDFGIAALIRGTPQPRHDRRLVGTVGYFAPEQLTGAEVDHRVDIFGVGVMMYEALCGRQPFDAKDTAKLRKQNRRAAMPRPRKVNPELPPELEAVLLRALERKPRRRYSSCEEMLADLRPLAPHPAGMGLALGSFVRSLFAKSPDIVGGPWRRSPETSAASPAVVDVAACISRSSELRLVRAQLEDVPATTFSTFASPGMLAAQATSARERRAILVDVDDPAFVASDLLTYQVTCPQPALVLTICDAYETRAVAVADAVGAAEMLVRPLRADVVRSALTRVIEQIRRVNQQRSRPGDQLTNGRERPLEERLLLVTADAALGARITADFRGWGYLVDVAPGPAVALQMMNTACYKSVIYDEAPHEAPDATFAGLLRALPGVGLVPVLFLRAPGTRGSQLTLPARTASRSRTTSSVVLVSALHQLQAITHLGRIFRRLPMDADALLSYGGHTIRCRVVNVSRGGVMVTAGQMPALHTHCTITVETGVDQPFTLCGRVVRLELDEAAENSQAGVAIAFGPSPRDDEAQLIAHVVTIATNHAPLPTPAPVMGQAL